MFPSDYEQGEMAKQARTSSYPCDPTKWAPVEHESEVLATADYDDADTSGWAFCCYLEYPNEVALRHAKRYGILGHHSGNVLVVFPESGECYSSVDYYRNTGVNADSVYGMGDYLETRCQPIDANMAMRIHPRVFARMRSDMNSTLQWAEESTGISGNDDGLSQLENDAAWILGITENLPSKATFGDGSPVPQE